VTYSVEQCKAEIERVKGDLDLYKHLVLSAENALVVWKERLDEAAATYGVQETLF
jgi:hypothetical protein